MRISTVVAGFSSLTLVAFLSQLPTSSQSSQRNFKEHHVVTLTLSDYHKDLQYLAEAGIDIAGVNADAKLVDVIVDDNELQSLRLMFNDKMKMVKRMDTSLAPDAAYIQYPAVIEKMKALASDHSDIMSLVEVGKSVENKPIMAMKISDNVQADEGDEPVILFNAMHHAREVMTTEVAIDTLEQLAAGYGTDAKTTGWINDNEIWVLPMLNPDGNHKVWHGNNMWRKNTKGGYGVDLNRNYPEGWNSCNGSSGSQSNDTYRGPSAGSEPETKTLMALVEKIRPVFNISYHSYSELVLYPFGCSSKRTMNRDVVEGIGRAIAQALPSDESANGKYTPGTPWELLYNADGGDIDWMYQQMQVIPYVIELNGRSQGFQPSYASWRDKTVTKLRKGWALLLDRLSGSGIRGSAAAGATITVRSEANQMLASPVYKVGNRGTFHVVVKPGRYSVVINQAGESTTHSVVVEDSLVQL